MVFAKGRGSQKFDTLRVGTQVKHIGRRFKNGCRGECYCGCCGCRKTAPGSLNHVYIFSISYEYPISYKWPVMDRRIPYKIWLVVWNMNFMIFHILGISSSQLTFIFLKMVKTTNQYIVSISY
jgi:hypothetical protein